MGMRIARERDRFDENSSRQARGFQFHGSAANALERGSAREEGAVLFAVVV
jgi:hypothetical protein